MVHLLGRHGGEVAAHFVRLEQRSLAMTSSFFCDSPCTFDEPASTETVGERAFGPAMPMRLQVRAITSSSIATRWE